jgi:catechol 2,3-dioxygenase-like lactoylglutathione lyase family enzyme
VSDAAKVRFNWIGLAVTDLARSRRFYEELLGFTYQRQLVPTDEGTSKICRVPSPTNLTAVYLVLDGFCLELLYWDRPGNPAAAEHPMNQPGLTHISIAVDDIGAVVAKVPEYGGTVLDETDVGPAICILDPDGQVVELLAART